MSSGWINQNKKTMSVLSGRPVVNPYEIRRYAATNKSFISKMIDKKTLFEAFPRMKDYSFLEPAVRKVADWSKESLLTKGGSLFNVFENAAKVVYDSCDNIRHKLYIEDNDLRATIMRKDYTAGQKLGKGNMEFSLWTDVEWFGERDIILLDSAQYAPLLVMSAGYDGGLWELRVKLTADGYINADEIGVGDGIHQIGAARGEAADVRGNVNLGKDNSYIEFSTPKSSMGWEFTVTDGAWKTMYRNEEMYGLGYSQPDDPKSFQAKITTNMLEMKFMAATDKMIDRWLTYGKSAGKFETPFIDRLTQKAYKLGPGFYEWMKYAKTDYYNQNSFTIEWLANIMAKRWHNNVAPEDRVVDFGTGQYGLKLWEDACQKYGIKSYIENAEMYEQKAGGGFDGKRNAVIINKKQIVGAFLPQFGLIRVHYLPHLDDDQFEKRRYRGYSIRSGEFIALNTGFGDGSKSNIYIVKDDQENGFGYGIGFWSPYGATQKNRSLATRWPCTEGSKNIYKMFRDESMTIVVKDASAIMWLKPALK